MLTQEYVSKLIYPYPISELESRMNKDKSFLGAYDPVTVISKQKAFMIYEIVNLLKDIKGDIAEIGVFKGGSSKMIAHAINVSASDKKFHMFDTFAGSIPLDYYTADDIGQGGSNYWNIPLDQVMKVVGTHKFITTHEGLFENKCHEVENNKFSFVHVDCDYYNAIMSCCKFFYPRLNDGGAMFFDDYGFEGTKGAKIAADQYFSDKPDKPFLCTTAGALIVKGMKYGT